MHHQGQKWIIHFLLGVRPPTPWGSRDTDVSVESADVHTGWGSESHEHVTLRSGLFKHACLERESNGRPGESPGPLLHRMKK